MSQPHDPRPLVITGATGAVGHALVRALLEREPGRPLRLLVRPAAASAGAPARAADERARGLFPEGAERGALAVWAGDVARPGLGLTRRERRRLGAGAAAVVHLAARTDFKGASLADYAPVNVDGAVRAAALALTAGAPLVHVSTAYVAGAGAGSFGEDDLERGQTFHNGYERSKWEAERRLVALSRQAGLRLVRVRPGVVLPDAPVAGIPEGPGPLAYLRLLSSLRPSATQEEGRALRATGDAAALLNLVPAPWVAEVLRAVVALGDEAGPCYHATAARPFTMAQLIEHLHHAVPGVRLVPTAHLDAPDTLERLVDRAGAVYAPYRRLFTRWDRGRLEVDLPRLADDGADPAWLDRVFAAHLAAWRQAPAPAPRPAPGCPAAHEALAVREYFAEHLAPIRGRALLAGLTTLTSTFTITVRGVGRWSVTVEAGRLIDAAALPPGGAPAGVDYALAPEAFLEAVAGARSPQALFFARAVTISGRIPEGLATATALEEFFRSFPWRPGRAAGELLRAQERPA